MKKTNKQSNKESRNIFGSISIGAYVMAVLPIAVIAGILYYLTMPAINIHSSGFWWYWLVVACIGIGFAALGNWLFNSDKDNFSRKIKSHTTTIVFSVIAGIWLMLFFITSISGWKMGHANQYANLITISEGDFESEIPQIADTAVIVDMKTAQKLGDRTIGSIAHPSWYEVDNEYDLISVNEELYRISSLKYRDIFAYIAAKDYGIPGYVIVNAKTQEAKYVSLEKGMKYAPSAFWSYDLTRHLRKQYPSYIFGKSFFEIDDDLNPYWITNVRTCKIGMRGAPIATSIITTNAITGESTEYNMDEIPDWIDHANSVDYLMQLVKWHYRYQEGWFNPSKTNIFRTTYYYRGQKQNNEENKYTPFDGYNSMLDIEGNIWFYTGLTPANATETNVGFLLLSPKSGQVKYYKAEGAEESSAQVAAEGLVQNLGYSASFPNMINVDGLPTYFMVLKDDAGLVQRYALCNVEQYQKVVQAETIEEAIRLYRVKMQLVSESVNDKQEEETSNNTNPVVTHDIIRLSGVVTEVKEAQIDGYTYYYFTIEDNDNIFMSSIQNSNMQPLGLKVDAKVDVEYYSEGDIAIVTKIIIQ